MIKKWYLKNIFPRLICSGKKGGWCERIRPEVVGLAKGKVLEIGMGAGHNIKFYNKDVVERVLGVDVSEALLLEAESRVADAKVSYKAMKASAHDLPFPENTFDSVVSTWTMCSIPDPAKALSEIRRVLKPGGDFLFVEHGVAPGLIRRACQWLGNPITKACIGGCHLNRDINMLIKRSKLGPLHMLEYGVRFRFLLWMFQGGARK